MTAASTLFYKYTANMKYNFLKSNTSKQKPFPSITANFAVHQPDASD
jgi:hypothetical protein